MQLGRRRLEQPDVAEPPERALRRPRAQNLVILLEHPRWRALRDLLPVRADGLQQPRLDREIEPRRERDRAQHAHRILAQPEIRLANRTDDSIAQVVEARDVVDDRKRRDVVEQRVDGEVAAEGVLFGRAEGIVAMNQMFVVYSGGRCPPEWLRGGDVFLRSRGPTPARGASR